MAEVEVHGEDADTLMHQVIHEQHSLVEAKKFDTMSVRICNTKESYYVALG